jgi:hypothetical protein
MTFQQKLALLTAIAAGLAIACVAGPSRPQPVTARFAGAPAFWLLVVASALIMVGVVSGTVLRHVVQIAPLVLGAAIIAIRPSWAACIAAPLFAFWLLVMGAIWLFLLGVSRFLTGTFIPAEIALTILIGAGAMLGLAAVYQRRPVPMVGALCGIAALALLQFGAMWLSTLPLVARW